MEILGILAVIVIVLAFAFLRIVREYERAVVFRLGRLAGVRGPGLFVLIPLVEKTEKIDLRTITLDVPAQEIISKDNVPVKVDAVLYFRVMDPARAVVEVENFLLATSQIAQTTLRSVTGKATFDELLAEREKLNKELHDIIDLATDPWGIKVMAVEIKRVETPEDMQRAIAKQAEAERIRRAKIILAEGEFQAAGKLREAADVLGAEPIKLRYLETLSEAAREKSVTILFPMELTEILKKLH